MSEKFEQLKAAKKEERFVKGLLFGFSCGIFATGLSILLLKLSEIASFLLYGIIIGWIVFAIVFTLRMVLGKKSDKAFAKNLDDTYALQESVQTAVEFRETESVIVRLQRQQTERMLDTLPAAPPFYKRYWKNAVALLLAAAMLLTGCLIPVKEKTPQPSETPVTDAKKFTFTTWMQNALTEVIANVRESGMSETPKTQTVTELENLYTTLQTTELRSEMQSLVISVIVKTDEYVGAANTYKQICLALDKSEYSPVRKLALAILPLDVAALNETLAEEMQNAWDAKTLTTDLALFAPDVYLRLQESQAAENDPLATEIKRYADSFLALAEEFGKSEISDEKKTEKLSALYENAETVLGGEIEKQAENRSMCRYVKNQLADIFQIDEDDLPELSVDSEPSIGKEREDVDDQPNDGDGGGAGDGEHLYGGSDTVYDPEKGQVAYGEVFDKYKAEIEKLYDSLSEEEREIISAYFSKLSNGAKQDDTNNP